MRRSVILATILGICLMVSLATQIRYLAGGCRGSPILKGTPMFTYAIWFASCAAVLDIGGMISAATAFCLYGIGDMLLEVPGMSALIAGAIVFSLGHVAQIVSIAKLPFIPELRNGYALALAMISVVASVAMAITAAISIATKLGALVALGVAVYMMLVGSISGMGVIRARVFLGAFYFAGAHLIQLSDLIIIECASDRTGILIMSLYWIGSASLAFVPSYLALSTKVIEESRN